ncbi:MAG: M48 family metallopeptidase, partial [Candidatus Omnitrophica bacterium]|nr:M48 family metallopeptidase [Candidatus Omnitrophota bacterium]
EKDIGSLKRDVLKPELFRILEQRAMFTEDKLEIKDYFHSLLDLAGSNGVDMREMGNIGLLGKMLLAEQNIDFEKAERERGDLIGILQKNLSASERKELAARTVLFAEKRARETDYNAFLDERARCLKVDTAKYPEFARYSNYLLLYHGLDREALFKEIRDMERLIFRALASEEKELAVIFLDDLSSLLRDYFAMKMSRDKEEELKGLIKIAESDYLDRAFASGESDDLGQVQRIKREIGSLRANIETMGDFYALTKKRDEAFVKRSKVSVSQGRIKVIVAGGYHSANLSDVAVKNGYSYYSIIPGFLDDEKRENHYYELISGGVSERMRTVALNMGVGLIAVASFNSPLGRKARGAGADLFKLRACLALAGEKGAKGIDLDGEYFDLAGRAVGREYVHDPERYLPFMTPGKIKSGGSPRNTGFDRTLIKALSEKWHASEADIERDYEITLEMERNKLMNKGFIDPITSKVSKDMHRVYGRLVENILPELGNTPGEFRVVDDNRINAFVFRNRKDVFFFKGLIEELNVYADATGRPLTDDMMAFIIAHELGHVVQSTSTHGLDLSIFYGDAAPYKIRQLLVNSEYDADSKALDIMDKAGFSVRGALEALRFLEYIKTGSQASAIMDSHPYIDLRRHRVTQIIYDQQTRVFRNVAKAETPFASRLDLTRKDVDFRKILDTGEKGLFSLLEEADSMDKVVEALSMIMTRRRLDAFRSLVARTGEREAFLKDFYAYAADYFVMKAMGDGTKKLHDRYDDLTMAGSVCGFGSVRTGWNRDKVQAVKPRMNSRTRVSEREKDHAYKNKIADIVNSTAGKLGNGDLNGILMDPYELARYVRKVYKKRGSRLEEKQEEDEDIIKRTREKLRKARKVSETEAGSYADLELSGLEVAAVLGRKELHKTLSDPRLLISLFVYTKCVSFAPMVTAAEPIYGLSIDIPVNAKRLYMENPRFTDVSAPEGRGRILETLIAQYLLTTYLPRSELYNGDLAGYLKADRAPWRSFRHVLRSAGLPYFSKEESGRIFRKIYSALPKQLPEFFRQHVALKMLEDYVGVSIETGSKGDKDDAGKLFASPKTLTGFSMEYRRRSAADGEDISGYVENSPLIRSVNAVLENPKNRDMIYPEVAVRFRGCVERLKG